MWRDTLEAMTAIIIAQYFHFKKVWMEGETINQFFPVVSTKLPLGRKIKHKFETFSLNLVVEILILIAKLPNMYVYFRK